ncbi:3'-5' exonuclease [Gemmatimonas phototrophica]|uniref:3'-5' exonuclease n=1 Tax=Gemmatimonas phototrophica TaxID=1379270 RepID=UPI0011AE9F0D|nr:3'-5' exonuclease [Gemmatimonas phototrophica]
MSGPFPGAPRPFGTAATPRPTTLSGRALRRLTAGPLDAVTLMRDVCQVDRLQGDAAERMAHALLGSHPEFVCLPSGHWALAEGVAEGLAVPLPAQVGSTTKRGTGSGRAPENSPRLRDIAFAVVDVETTGGQAASGDRITEIAIAQVRGGEVTDVYSQLVNPERPIPPYIMALTQITWEMVRDQPSFRHIADQVVEHLRGAVFAAHNAAFDWRFVSEELRRAAGHELSGPRLCTVRMAKALLPQLPRRSLDHVTRYFGIDIEGRHRAGGDAVATAKALCRMLQVAEGEGVSTWAELDARLNPSAKQRRTTASDRRRRAFPLPAIEDDPA